MKSFLAVFISCLILCSNLALARSHWTSRLHPLNDAVLIATPENQHVEVIRALQSAKKSIAMSMYHLTDADIISTLIQASKQNISVQVLLDGPSLSNPKYKAIFDQLVQAKVAVYASSPQFAITHSKTFVIDGKLAFISTMNLVGHFQEMRDFGLFTQDVDVVREMLLVFKTDLANSKNQTMISPQLTNPNLIWSPVNSERKLAELIDLAKTEVQLTVENLGQTTVIVEALKRALMRKVLVRLLVPECDLNPNPYYNFPALFALAALGAQSRTAPSPSAPETPYLHAKSIIVDHRIAFLGSQNFSFTSLTKARETGVVFTNIRAIHFLDIYFEKDWKTAKSLPPTTPTTCQTMTH